MDYGEQKELLDAIQESGLPSDKAYVLERIVDGKEQELRRQIATSALQGLLAGMLVHTSAVEKMTEEAFAKQAVALADALIKRLKEE